MPVSFGRSACLAALGALLLVGGCDSRDPEFDVYVAGWESDGTVQVATLWKNGIAVALSDATHAALATSIVIADGNVYVGGGVNGGLVDVATYWKNGAAVPLTDGTRQAFAEAIAVSGDEVFVAGYEGSRATYWKNGTPVVLTDGSSRADALAITVSGGDVYVAGFEIVTTEVTPGSFYSTNVAMVWKNGVSTALTSCTNPTDCTRPAVGSGISVVGSNIYVAGYQWEGSVLVAKVWRNGAAEWASDETHAALATSIAVSDGDVYVAGGVDGGRADVATYWKNGAAVALTDGTRQSFVEAIAVVGPRGRYGMPDVYAAGYTDAGATYWKNGEQIVLTSGRFDSDARGIAIVER